MEMLHHLSLKLRGVITALLVVGALVIAPIDDAAAACRGAWAEGVNYAAGDTVTYNGSVYTARVAHGCNGCGWNPVAAPSLWALGGTCSGTPTPTTRPTPTPTTTARPTPTPTSRPTPTPTPVTGMTTVDLLVVYDSYSSSFFSGDPLTAMQSWVNQMNAVYRDSQAGIQLRLVGVRAHEETGATMSEVLGNLRADATIAALRNELRADFVSMLHRTGSCGVGYVSVSAGAAFNVVGPNCGALTMAHELGHNMGLNHSRRQGNTSGTRYRYGLGYGVDNSFATVMAYPQSFNAKRVARFSNPNLVCNNLPCGVPVGDPNEAYAALAIFNVRTDIANFR
jgi:hypothetical protein